LHSLSDLERVAESDLATLMAVIVANGALPDPVYLAHIYGGRTELAYSSGALNYEADRRLRETWKEWYEYQDTGEGSELDDLCNAVLRFRNSLPFILPLEPSHKQLSDEVARGLVEGRTILQSEVHNQGVIRRMDYVTRQPIFPLTLGDALDTLEAVTIWLTKMAASVESTALREARAVGDLKRWDTDLRWVYAARLHGQA